jgi:hypothetical protein
MQAVLPGNQADATILEGTPVENILAFTEAVDKLNN